jgi:hypothetical protein
MSWLRIHSRVASCALIATLFIPSLASGQASGDLAFRQLVPLCGGFVEAMGDLFNLSKGISDQEEKRGALDLAASAELNGERCNAARGLFVLFAMLPVDRRPAAAEYITLRIDIWTKSLGTELEFANRMMGATHLPGVARQAESFRNRLRDFQDKLKLLRPT